MDWLVREKHFSRIVLRTKSNPSTRPDGQRNGKLCDAHLLFDSIDSLVVYATQHWRDNLVTTDISQKGDYDILLKRPFFLLLSVDAPLMTRWLRYKERLAPGYENVASLETFVQMSDAEFYGSASNAGHMSYTGNGTVYHKASLRIINDQSNLEKFYTHLEDLDLVNPDRVRPSWDAYFMQLASLASLRSNCMKRRVGCVLVRNKRVISTGYNGTPRGLTNCNEGGCGRCNSAPAGGVSLGTCLCLHAEENALLESGRERVGAGATLYCDTCPCLTCSVKIAQVGVKEVVYNQAYSMDDQSAEVLREAGVVLRQFSPPYQD